MFSYRIEMSNQKYTSAFLLREKLTQANGKLTQTNGKSARHAKTGFTLAEEVKIRNWEAKESGSIWTGVEIRISFALNESYRPTLSKRDCFAKNSETNLSESLHCGGSVEILFEFDFLLIVQLQTVKDRTRQPVAIDLLRHFKNRWLFFCIYFTSRLRRCLSLILCRFLE